ncbi:MAG: gamma-glutamyl-gamma-aminobutyrate hydrolase family protein [Bacillota bacterium]
MKPLIGITCSYDRENDRYFLGSMYARAVEAGGGIPLPLAYTMGDIDGIARLINGLLLSGGPDVDPVYFGEDPATGMGEVCPERDAFEMDLARKALGAGIPVLGICRGIQVLNIAAGGDIYQDIGSGAGEPVIKHFQQAPRYHPTHNILVEEKTMLASILGPGSVRVNSYHHQAVRRTAPGFIVSARSADGVIEAVESRDRGFALGVQCHPEAMWERRPLFLGLFKRLIEAAAGKRPTV